MSVSRITRAGRRGDCHSPTSTPSAHSSCAQRGQKSWVPSTRRLRPWQRPRRTAPTSGTTRSATMIRASRKFSIAVSRRTSVMTTTRRCSWLRLVPTQIGLFACCFARVPTCAVRTGRVRRHCTSVPSTRNWPLRLSWRAQKSTLLMTRCALRSMKQRGTAGCTSRASTKWVWTSTWRTITVGRRCTTQLQLHMTRAATHCCALVRV
mmetsp:Transcript_63067/g.152531  ORF Transcript_63067/g.152531 Transcript_63067/m.152531 type:complete len:207 (-) Transcript_63067:25-645(-)